MHGMHLAVPSETHPKGTPLQWGCVAESNRRGSVWAESLSQLLKQDLDIGSFIGRAVSFIPKKQILSILNWNILVSICVIKQPLKFMRKMIAR